MTFQTEHVNSYNYAPILQILFDTRPISTALLTAKWLHHIAMMTNKLSINESIRTTFPIRK